MKLALITGGQRRLGAAIARELAANGWALALHGQRVGEVEGADELGEWHAFAADLGDPAAVDALIPAVVARFGVAPELLVNNASLFRWDDAKTATSAALREHQAVNVEAPVALALSLALHGTGGAIVNIVDQRVRNPVPDQLSYTLSKTALAAATRPLAVALAPHWRVNGVAPGLTLPTPDYTDEQLARVVGAMPLKRLPQPEDVARAVHYLAEAPAVTGQTLFVDGGASLKSFERDFLFL